MGLNVVLTVVLAPLAAKLFFYQPSLASWIDTSPSITLTQQPVATRIARRTLASVPEREGRNSRLVRIASARSPRHLTVNAKPSTATRATGAPAKASEGEAQPARQNDRRCKGDNRMYQIWPALDKTTLIHCREGPPDDRPDAAKRR